jgi:alpha-tubulin suppressor-like RCC1 family protein
MASSRSLVATILLVAAVTGCRYARTFSCEIDEDCRRATDPGLCEPTGYCSFTDTACASGRRYDDLASSEYAGKCVDDVMPMQPDASTIPSSCVAGLEAGAHHVCALRNDQSVWCWGSNGANQLTSTLAGNPANPVCAPTEVTSLTGMGVTEIAAGGDFTCVLAKSKVYCFGDNTYGQIGNNTITQAMVPTLVTGLPTLAGVQSTQQIAVGSAHACALSSINQKVYCWGDNGNGQVGEGGTMSVLKTATQVKDTSSTAVVAQKIVTGANHSCALDGDTLWCWGQNGSGQLGFADMIDKQVATKVMTGVVDVAAGDNFTCILKVLGGDAVWCFGDDSAGQLGTAGLGHSATPVQVPGVTISHGQLVLGGQHGCAFVPGSPATCWGSNASDQISSVMTAAQAPMPLNDPVVPTFATAMANGTCVSDGMTIQCRGENTYCELAHSPADTNLHPSGNELMIPCP